MLHTFQRKQKEGIHEKRFLKKLENKKMHNTIAIKLWYKVIWLLEFSKTEDLSFWICHSFAS